VRDVLIKAGFKPEDEGNQFFVVYNGKMINWHNEKLNKMVMGGDEIILLPALLDG